MASKKLKYEDWKVSGISRKYPTYRESGVVTVNSWLNGKQKDDEAEGLWRVYNTLYDFTDFIERHPGGSFWLKETQGTDITEHFEAHHISNVPERMLEKFKIRQASKPRNYTLTLHENGFYKTLKRRVQKKLDNLDYKPKQKSNLIHFGLLASTIALAMATAATGSAILEILAALSLSWLVIVAHNYFHQRDNWQMYTFNLSLMNFHTWRISHALSHHIYPNTLHDLELSLFEPLMCWLPNPHYSSKLKRIFFLLLQPITYILIFPFQLIARVLESLLHRNRLYWHDVIGFSLPVLMLLVSDASFFIVMRQWLSIICLSSFIFAIISVNGAHHDPKIYHDGDANRADRDWGIFQLDTIIDRTDIKNSLFMVLTHFGEHALHHLFPTLDHGILPQLYPEFWQTVKEFNLDIPECTALDHVIGQNKQLLRTEPNTIPPGGILK